MLSLHVHPNSPRSESMAVTVVHLGVLLQSLHTEQFFLRSALCLLTSWTVCTPQNPCWACIHRVLGLQELYFSDEENRNSACSQNSIGHCSRHCYLLFYQRSYFCFQSHPHVVVSTTSTSSEAKQDCLFSFLFFAKLGGFGGAELKPFLSTS